MLLSIFLFRPSGQCPILTLGPMSYFWHLHLNISYLFTKLQQFISKLGQTHPRTLS